jgi:uncharacterized membrane protein YraQ (UPF0718 family)
VAETLRREFIYLWYYFDIQARQIAGYWILGMVLGSLISVFGKEKIHGLFARLHGRAAASRNLILYSEGKLRRNVYLTQWCLYINI